jgi:gamma-glutamyltranspeptidase
MRASALPPFHAITVTVPGAAAAWEDAVQQWGTLGLSQASAMQQEQGLTHRGAAVWSLAGWRGQEQQQKGVRACKGSCRRERVCT